MSATASPVTYSSTPDKTHTVDDGYGYRANVFPDKEKQMTKACSYIEKTGFIPKNLVKNEVSWFYGNLGIDDYYFALESVETIANHIMGLYGAKILAFTRNENALDIKLEEERDDSSVFIHSSRPGVSELSEPQCEKRIDDKYLDTSTADNAFRLESYRSIGTAFQGEAPQLRSYFVTRCQFVNRRPSQEQMEDITQVADKTFLRKATEHTRRLYENIMRHVLLRKGPVIEMYEEGNKRERRLIIGYPQRSTMRFFSSMSDLYHYYSLYSTRKYVEQFSNGVTIMGLYLNALPSATIPIESSIHQVMKETSLIYCLPTTPLQHLFQTNQLSVQETVYGFVSWIFAQHFLNRLGKEYYSLQNILDTRNPVHEEVLTKLKKRLRQETFTREYILDIIKRYPDLIRLLYGNFAKTHYVNHREAKLQPSISYQRFAMLEILTDEQLQHKIKALTSNAHEQLVFESFLTFNKHVLKTNFYQPTKVALSFRLDPSFLPEIEYPSRLFGMFLIIGSEFRGFHLRFQDIARGGIRIIRSRNREAYSINQRTLFDENYALAATQQRKNKDIPEGGSKGTILLDIDQQDKPRQAFEKYVDSILDLLIVGQTPGIKEKLVDLNGNKPEILFFGPDEGTADYMDLASEQARRRNASFWKAFTTGKSQSLGGIPHDVYGMTTRSVHQYVLGIYRTFGLKEEECTKVQTGGPDGDLGSNEIKISMDKTIAIVDGSGVLYDRQGINREELLRLADERRMISHFDTSKLSREGFRVLLEDSNVRLFNGQIVENGFQFRNTFHTNPLASATLFVPCGGRPESVDLYNVHLLEGFSTSKKEGGRGPLFKYIVEGANLFFTQEARLRLERQGVVIFKDASANKGGVTSSSFEVLAALAFTDAEFAEHMCVRDGRVPEFYQAYVQEVQEIIERNARIEFEALWREHKKTKLPISVLSDELSVAIVQLSQQLQESTLWKNNKELRHEVLRGAFPKLLLDKLPLETLLERIPESYVKAIFGAYLASQFVYEYGPKPDNFAFFEFMRERYYQ